MFVCHEHTPSCLGRSKTDRVLYPNIIEAAKSAGSNSVDLDSNFPMDDAESMAGAEPAPDTEPMVDPTPGCNGQTMDNRLRDAEDSTLLKTLDKIILQSNLRVLIICALLMCQFLVEAILKLLDFKVLSLRGGMSAFERTQLAN